MKDGNFLGLVPSLRQTVFRKAHVSHATGARCLRAQEPGKKQSAAGREYGYVALLAVLIIGAAALAIATTLLISGSDSQREALIEQQSVQARNLASACAEEGMQQIHDSSVFTGTNNLSLGQGSCTYTVTSTGSSTRTIDASGTINNVVRKVKVYVTINVSSLSVTSWQDVT